MVGEFDSRRALGEAADPAESSRVEVAGDEAVAEEVRAWAQESGRTSTAKFGKRRASFLSVVQTASQSFRFAAAM